MVDAEGAARERAFRTEVLAGLHASDRGIPHPPDSIAEAVAFVERQRPRVAAAPTYYGIATSDRGDTQVTHVS
ncbi:hypothetical protein [Antarctobacter sp.]|uniref:hypothetical protein n=1 Tax=Antarctobacter sp. TaxID=1872577 RepID=UPI003A947E13